MATDIETIAEFARNGEKSIEGLSLVAGFPREQKPYRQWFNYLFNIMSKKTNELVDAVNEINKDASEIVEFYAVGDVYTTTKEYPDNSAVNLRHGYGEWVKYAEGRALVGHSSQIADEASYKTMGNKFGTNKETLTIKQIPSHKHSKNDSYNKFSARASDTTKSTIVSADRNVLDRELAIGDFTNQDWLDATEQAVGGGEAHNNIPPSIVVAYWLRVS